ncbi:MAG TPA: Ig-like domain repeat protein [Thermoanaerobaculia bacterium]|nr:Ig-like domain repeat protein [Thermoanaerobaculia bacterium]
MLRSTAIVLCFVAGVAAAQQPYLVKDLRTTGPISGSSYPRNFVAVGPTLYFLDSNREAFGLWRSDGTAAGTTLVAPMDAGSLFSLGNRLIAFSINGLWLSDGTATGTVFVDGIHNSSDQIEMNGKLFFIVSPNHLYATDGTAAGTTLITDLPQNFPSSSRLLTRFGTRIAFTTDMGLGVTDGTPGGTAIISSAPRNFGRYAVGTADRFYFQASDDLWVSDGTPAGTLQVKSSCAYCSLTAFGDRVLFSSGGERWISDGTNGGTFALTHVHTNSSVAAVLNGIAYFAGEDGNGSLALWRSDGTIAGTRIAALWADRAYIYDISAAAGKLWLSLNHDSKWKLWVSDGTSEGTQLLAPITVLETPRSAFNGRAAFSANDNEHAFEPWSSDGTPAGTVMMADLYPNIAPASSPDIRGTIGNGVVFGATGNDGIRGQWISDGTVEGTRPFAPPATSRISDHGLLYFDDGTGGVWRTDGTSEGTRLLLHQDNSRASFAVAAGVLYISHANAIYAIDGSGDPLRIGEGNFVAAIDGWGDLVFRSEGDPFLHAISGTSAPRLLTSIPQPYPQTFQSLFTAGGFVCYFTSLFPYTELWRTDGTPASLTRIARFSANQYPLMLGHAGDRMLFTIDDGVHGPEPWVTDGTAEGTSLLADIRPGPAGSVFRTGVSLGDRALFAADDGTFGLEPWVSDGTPAGTHMVADIAPGKASSIQNEIGVMKGIAFFAATDTAHGVELWRSDGTAGGTQLAGDLEPGPLSSAPDQLTAADDTLYFTAETIANGRELWALPVPGRTISIGDGHATEGAASGQLFVTLDAPATEPITARWSALGKSQTIAFQPGELRKAISIPIAPGRGPRAIRVRLDSADGAAVIRPVGNLVVQAEPAQADIEVSVTAGSKDGLNRPLVVVTNHGPSPVPWVKLTFTGVPSPDPPQTLGSLRAGESVSVPTFAGLYRATASAPLPDPDPSNNSMTYRAVAKGYTVMTLSPAGLTVGMHAKLSIYAGDAVTLFSSDPRVLAVPQSVKAPAELDVVALAEGTTSLSADGIAYLPVTVGPPGPYRWPSELKFTIEDAGLSYGTRRPFLAHVTANSPGGFNIGGTVTILDGDKSVVTIPVDANGNAAVNLNSLLPGDHLITATYSGDANLLPAVSPSSVALHILAPVAVTFRGVARPVSATEDEVTIEVVVPAGTPGGTMTLKDLARNVLAEHVPVVAGRAVAVIPHLTMVTVDYSGDELFAPAVVNVPLTQSRRRASRP